MLQQHKLTYFKKGTYELVGPLDLGICAETSTLYECERSQAYIKQYAANITMISKSEIISLCSGCLLLESHIKRPVATAVLTLKRSEQRRIGQNLTARKLIYGNNKIIEL